jgi:hypothetical protein
MVGIRSWIVMKMGKRKLAGSIKGTDHSTTKSCYSSQGITAHLRGWDFGLRIEILVDENGTPLFEIWETGGSNNPSNKRQVFLTNVDENNF